MIHIVFDVSIKYKIWRNKLIASFFEVINAIIVFTTLGLVSTNIVMVVLCWLTDRDCNKERKRREKNDN